MQFGRSGPCLSWTDTAGVHRGWLESYSSGTVRKCNMECMGLLTPSICKRETRSRFMRSRTYACGCPLRLPTCSTCAWLCGLLKGEPSNSCVRMTCRWKPRRPWPCLFGPHPTLEPTCPHVLPGSHRQRRNGPTHSVWHWWRLRSCSNLNGSCNAEWSRWSRRKFVDGVCRRSPCICN